MIKNKIKNKRVLVVLLSVFFIVSVLLILTPIAFVNAYFTKRAYPNVWIDNILVSGKTEEEIIQLLSQNTLDPKPLKLIVKQDNEQSFTIDPLNINFKYDFATTAANAVKLNKGTTRIDRIVNFFAHINRRYPIPIQIKYDTFVLDDQLSVIAGQISVLPTYPTARLENGHVVIEKGMAGSDINVQKVKFDIDNSLRTRKNLPIEIVTKEINPSLTAEQANEYKVLSEKYIGKKIQIQYEFTNIDVMDKEIIDGLLPSGDFKDPSEIIKKIVNQINRAPQNSVFVFQDDKVKEFTPAKVGLLVKEDELKSEFLAKLTELRTSSEKALFLTAPVNVTPPEIDTSDVNNLGIRELIGRGTSKYKGSIPSRVHNVALAASRINGTLIKPGETFSFNNSVGDVSKLTGYKEAYVIKDGKTVLGDGGGLCQVSTTIFRAALNAGLPVLERRGHSYRVGYYEQDSAPGMDATVYSPTTDFKFVNNTPGHILIQATADSKNYSLVFELYGTSDGRVATTSKPVMANVSAPPEDLYQDDPTLPNGQIKQIEHKAWGGKSSFNYEVKKGEEIIYQKTFVTNYRPWQAVYLRGTAAQ